MKPIFISYRRDDGSDTAQLLQSHLQKMFGEDNVFLDVDTIKAGEKFPDSLKNAVSSAKVVIVMVGNNWKGIDPKGNRMLQEEDWVRKELELALSDEKKKIFPLFVKGATPSKAFDELPASLKPLTEFNIHNLREKEFKQDFLPLIPLIEPHINLADPLKDLPLDLDKYAYPAGSPFKELHYFTEKDARIFFGRGNDIRKLYNKVKNSEVLFLYGQSGIGKSSLLFAGLKPRMENKDWEIAYFRRATGINLAEKLNDYVAKSKDGTKRLVILDQVEEIYTNPDLTLSPEAEAQQLLEAVRHAKDQVHLILSFRKECLAEIKNLFTGLPASEMYLEALEINGILEAIKSITQSEEAKDFYELEFKDAGVPIAIAQLVLSDEAYHAAPFLQILLSKMWEKVEENHPRVFTKDLLDEVKSENLVALVYDQIAAMSEKHKAEAESGMILDILYYFTTPRGTSDTHTYDEIMDHYGDPGIMVLITELTYKYLLSGTISDKGNSRVIRLAHDSLAPIIRELFGQSTLAGQKATKLLDSKRIDIETGNVVEFSKPDISIIDAGKEGMRKWTEKEQAVVEKSRRLIQEYDEELEKINKQLVLKVKEAQEQTQKLQNLVLVAAANEQLTNNPTIAIRIAELAWRKSYNLKPSTQVKKIISKVFYQSIEGKRLFYESNLEHANHVITSSFSPDGKRVVTASRDNTIKIWDSLSGNLILNLTDHTAPVNCAVFSPDGKKIASSSDDNTVKLWDSMSGALIADMRKHKDYVHLVAFSPSGKSLLTASGDKTVKIWDAKFGGLLTDLKGHTDYITFASFSSSGERIITTSSDKTSKIWNAETGELIMDLKGDKEAINCGAFSPDDKKIVTTTFGSSARVYDSNSGELLIELKWQHDDIRSTSPTQNVGSVFFSPDGKKILIASGDINAKLWESETGKLLIELKGHTNIVPRAIFSSDGKRILTASWDNTSKIWDSESGELIADLKGHIDSLNNASFSHDGLNIVTSSFDKTAKIWDLTVVNVIDDLKGHSDSIIDAVFSIDGRKISTASRDHTAKVWDTKSGQIITELNGHTDYVSAVTYSPDGKKILTASADRTAKVWDAEDGKLIWDLKGHNDKVTKAAFSHDGMKILTISDDKIVIIWDASSGKLIKKLKGHKEAVREGYFSDSGNQIITFANENTAKVWDVASGRLTFNLRHNWIVLTAVFSPSTSVDKIGGSKILTGSSDATAKLWDSKTGKLIAKLNGHSAAINIVSFSSDGRFIVTGSADKTAKIWNSDTGELIQELIGHTDYVYHASFSSDSTTVVTSSFDRTAKLWDVESGELIADLKGHTDWVSKSLISPDGKKILTISLDKTLKLWHTPNGIMDWLSKQNIYKLTQKDLENLGIDFIKLDD